MTKGGAKEGSYQERPKEKGETKAQRARYYLELSDVCWSYRFVYVLSLIYLSVVLSLEPLY